MISLMIIKQIEFQKRKQIIFIIDHFFNSKELYQSLKKTLPHIEIFWFETKKQALKKKNFLKNDHIFIDSDVGLRNWITLSLLKINLNKIILNIYEEGIGTYRNNLSKSSLKKTIFSAFGIGTHFGHFWGTENIYVFNPTNYIKETRSKKNVVRIQGSLKTWIQNNDTKIKNIFPNLKNTEKFFKNQDHSETAIIYLSGWKINTELMQCICDKRNSFIKLHPHLKKKPDAHQFGKTIIIPNSIPAEIILLQLIKNYKKIYVYHENSSSLHYVNDSKIIECTP